MERMERRTKYVNSFISGGCAGGFAKTIVAPFERIKILFQTTSRPFTYKAACKEAFFIYRSEGFRGLWRGNTAAVIQIFPFAAIQFAVFDFVQSTFTKPNSTGAQKNFWNFIAGSAAGISATIATYPSELIRTRMAIQTGNSANSGLIDTIRNIYVREGPRAFFRGMFPSFIGVIPYKGSGFLMFHLMKDKMKEHYPRLAHAKSFDFIFGAVAGFFSQLVSYPFDTIRRKMQAEHVLLERGEITKKKSVVGWFNYILKKEGARGIYKGVTVNMIKGPIACGASFAVKNSLHGRLDRAYAI